MQQVLNQSLAVSNTGDGRFNMIMVGYIFLKVDLFFSKIIFKKTINAKVRFLIIFSFYQIC